MIVILSLVKYIEFNLNREGLVSFTMSSTWNSYLWKSILSIYYDDLILDGSLDPLEDVDLDGTE